MKKIQNDHSYQHKTDIYSRFIAVLSLLLLLVTISSCSVIAGVFKAGMEFGIFMVLAVLVIIVFIIMRLRKK